MSLVCQRLGKIIQKSKSLCAAVCSLTMVQLEASECVLQAAATPAHALLFQIEYVQLRAAMLPAFARVVQACCSFQTSPPPAIAASLAMTTGLEKHRCQHVLSQVSHLQSGINS